MLKKEVQSINNAEVSLPGPWTVVQKPKWSRKGKDKENPVNPLGKKREAENVQEAPSNQGSRFTIL